MIVLEILLGLLALRLLAIPLFWFAVWHETWQTEKLARLYRLDKEIAAGRWAEWKAKFSQPAAPKGKRIERTGLNR